MIIIKCGIYNVRNDDIINKIINHYRSYDVRPLAFFSDAFIFQWFWNCSYAILIAMVIMHIGVIYLTYKICEKIDVKLNAFSLTLFCLCPILIQSLYWISASTRIVFSLFLCLLSIYLLLLYFDSNSKKKKVMLLILSVILNLICVGYYEQTIALNLFLTVFIIIILKKYTYLFIPIISTSWIGAWYVHFAMTGEMQTRGALNLAGIINNIGIVTNNFFGIYCNEFENFKISLSYAKNDVFGSAISIFITVIFAFFIFYLFKNKCMVNKDGSIWKKVCIGIIFLIVPMMPFLVLNTSIIAVRNLYFSTFGLAILLEVIIDFLLKLIKNELACNIVKTSLIAIFSFLFVMSNIDGVNNYKKVHELDNRVIGEVIGHLDGYVYKNKKSISINYDDNKLQKCKNLSNYVESVIESDWATGGKIQVMRKEIGVGKIYINPDIKNADYNFYFDDNMNLSKVIEGNGISYE